MGLFGKQAESRKSKKRGPGFVLAMSGLVVLVLVLALAGIYIGRSLAAVSSIDRDPSLNPSDYAGRPSAATPVDNSEPPLNIVLMGADSQGGQGRSDSLMVAHISGDRKNLYLVSFPRDMWVDIPGRGRAKINAAYAYGGPQLTVRTLESLTRVRMNHTVVIDFEGFVRLTQAIGGVEVYNPWATQHDTGPFPKGRIRIEGERALAYVRQRKPLPRGDLDRAHRQRTVVKAIIRKLVTPETVGNPPRFSDMVGRLADTMTVDESMTDEYITDLAMSMRLADLSDGVRLLQVPIKGYARIDGQAVDIVDRGGLAELSASLGGDAMGAYFDKHKDEDLRALGEVDPDE